MSSGISGRPPRVAVVGSTSPAGKQLRELLDADLMAWNLSLLDTDEYAGLLQEFEGDIEIVQVISPERLREVDAAVFTCAPTFLDEYIASGAFLPPTTVDATGGNRNGPVFIAGHPVGRLRGNPGKPNEASSPFAHEPGGREERGSGSGPGPESGGQRRILIAAGAETTILSRLLSRLDGLAPVEGCHATVIASAADRGLELMNRLQEETIEILNFQQSGEEHGDRLAFNLWGPGEAGARGAARIARQVGAMTPDRCPAPAVQIATAPVFQGTSLSVYVRLGEEFSVEDVTSWLTSGLELFHHSPGATPLDALGTDGAGISSVSEGAEPGAFWFWITADGLRLTARNAMELIRRSTCVGA